MKYGTESEIILKKKYELSEKPSFRLLLFNMYDIVLVTPKEEELQSIYDMTQDMLHKNGLIITLKMLKD